MLSFDDASPIRLVLLTADPTDDQIAALRDYVRRGGLLIDIMGTPTAATRLAALAGTKPIPATEAEVNGFSLLTDIDFDHPALAPFADPMFSDFTTLHFWKHRRIEAATLTNLRVLARFDDGDVAIGEIPLGDGRIVFFTSGWNRSDSQLAVWSKFVPLMNGLLESLGSPAADGGQLTVGDEIPWRTVKHPNGATRTLTSPDGTTRPLTDNTGIQSAEMPGIYIVAAEGISGTRRDMP